MPSMVKSSDKKKVSTSSKKTIENNTNHFEQIEAQKYANIKAQCRKSASLFEDNLFPATNASFFCKESKLDFKWLRPFEIRNRPMFCAADQTFPITINLNPGKLGNFWFLGAMSSLTSNKDVFEKVVPSGQSFEAPEYAGIFQFRFWYFGKWRTVVIDDRLPTNDGELVMSHERHLNQFWCSLLEKAYAKLVGCYESLSGSYTSEALEDFTGGLCETYQIKNCIDTPNFLFSIIYKSILHSSIILCCAESDEKKSNGGSAWGNTVDKRMESGIWQNQFYSINAINSIEVEGVVNHVQLIRLRNTCTGVPDWEGSWGPHSSEWEQISAQDKERFGLSIDADGDFWMNYEDFKNNFTIVDICNMPIPMPAVLPNRFYQWEVECHDGAWESGTAGGSSVSKGLFHTNPRFIFTVIEKNCDPEDDGFATVLIGLMQKDRPSKKAYGLFDLKIGFQIYNLDKEANRNPKANNGAAQRLTSDYFQKNKPIAGTKCYINIRQVFGRFRLKPGNYMIVPSTFNANMKGLFLLRIFSEKLIIKEELISMLNSDKPKLDGQLESQMIAKLFRPQINQIANQTEITNCEILHETLKKNIISEKIYFSIDKCQFLFSMYDQMQQGKVTVEQMRQLILDLAQCYAVFIQNDVGGDGCLNQDETKKSLDQLGIQVAPALWKIIMNRYTTEIITNNGTKKRAINFANFSVCFLKLRNGITNWNKKAKIKGDGNRANVNISVAIPFTIGDFLEQIISN